MPLVALTATASLSVRETIEEKLNLRNPITVLKSPEKVNIRYSVIKPAKGQDVHLVFTSILEELERKERGMERIIVFCRSHKHCRELYSTMLFAHPNIKKYIAMFHSTTEESVKENVIKSFADKHGEIRILFATIAFGMGIDVKGVHNIIHIGPPSDLDDYLQESGRAGRDGAQSYAVLMNYSGSSGRFQTAENMKQYVKNEVLCRRELILEPFGYTPSHDPNRPLHRCCDICATHCLCGGDVCSDQSHGRGFIEEKLCEQLTSEKLSVGKIASRYITKENRDQLRNALFDFRQQQLGTTETQKLISGNDIASGFPASTISDIMENVNFISDIDYLKEQFVFLNPQHVRQVMNFIIQYTDSLTSESGSSNMCKTTSIPSEEDSSDSETDSISDYKHLRLSSESSDQSEN